jgi:hypothetical protein
MKLVASELNFMDFLPAKQRFNPLYLQSLIKRALDFHWIFAGSQTGCRLYGISLFCPSSSFLIYSLNQ